MSAIGTMIVASGKKRSIELKLSQEAYVESLKYGLAYKIYPIFPLPPVLI